MISVAASVKRLVHPSSQTALGILEDGTPWLGALRGERESRIGYPPRRDQSRDVLADRGPMFETMTGSAADNPDVVVFGMTVDQKIAGCRVLVLTHASLDHRRVGHRGNTTLQ